jgi:carbamoyltransferase
MIILGISAYYHDSAAALIVDGKIVAAAQEERFTRIRHDSNFPIKAIDYCLRYFQINFEKIDRIVFYDKPFLKFERLLETYLAFAPKGFKNFSESLPYWVKDKLFQKNTIINELISNYEMDKIFWKNKLLFSKHHLSHAASAFYPSPFTNAAVITMDGVGEWTTTSVGIGEKNNLEIISEINFPHSLGLLYSAFTYYLGFKVNSGEYKVMGLAPYGKPKYIDLILNNLIELKKDGSFFLNMDYFDYCTNLKMTNSKFDSLFKCKRLPESSLTQKHMDIAASLQEVINRAVLNLALNVKKITKKNNLCLAGGVALNCVANGRIIKEKIFKNVWIQPASGDAGGAIGAALAVYYQYFGNKRKVDKNDSMNGSYLGPSYSKEEIENSLIKIGAKYQYFDNKSLINRTVEEISNGSFVGWFQDRMEFGPRALGNRSILADPRSKNVQKQLNLKIKFRESFRPFAPSILEEYVPRWFNLNQISPYMCLVADVVKKKRIKLSDDEENLFGINKLNIPKSTIPAVTHIDYSARIQTVSKKNKLYYQLIYKFYKKTGCPLLVNTSFNIRGEPIVNTPEDAFKCFMGTDLDLLVIGNFILFKNYQNKKLLKNYKYMFSLD